MKLSTKKGESESDSWERPTNAEGSGELVGEIKQDKEQAGGEEPGKTY